MESTSLPATSTANMTTETETDTEVTEDTTDTEVTEVTTDTETETEVEAEVTRILETTWDIEFYI